MTAEDLSIIQQQNLFFPILSNHVLRLFVQISLSEHNVEDDSSDKDANTNSNIVPEQVRIF